MTATENQGVFVDFWQWLHFQQTQYYQQSGMTDHIQDKAQSTSIRRQSVQSKMQSKSQLSSYTLLTPSLDKFPSDTIQSLLRSKISMYMISRPTQGRLTPILDLQLKEQKKSAKKTRLFSSSLDMPRIYSLQSLIGRQQELRHIYREKMESNFDQCFLFYMEILCAAIKYQYQISCIEIDRERSLVIDCIIYVVNTLVEIGSVDKLAFYFCVKGIRLCQIYGRMKEIGELLYLMGCVLRKMQRFQDSVVFLKKALQYIWRNRTEQTDQKQIQIYNLISQCLLQINQPEQSKIFAYKYQIGYLQKNNSKIIELSHELIDSVQHRKSKWHAVSRESMELLLQFDIEDFINTNANHLLKLDQKKFLDLMKINFQFLYDAFKADDMFFYEIPMPLEIVVETKKTTKRRSNQTKFLVKKKSFSVGNLQNRAPAKLLKIQHEKPKEFLIFNYRGVGVSKEKLFSVLYQLIKKIKIKLGKQ